MWPHSQQVLATEAARLGKMLQAPGCVTRNMNLRIRGDRLAPVQRSPNRDARDGCGLTPLPGMSAPAGTPGRGGAEPRVCTRGYPANRDLLRRLRSFPPESRFPAQTCSKYAVCGSYEAKLGLPREGPVAPPLPPGAVQWSGVFGMPRPRRGHFFRGITPQLLLVSSRTVKHQMMTFLRPR